MYSWVYCGQFGGLIDGGLFLNDGGDKRFLVYFTLKVVVLVEVIFYFLYLRLNFPQSGYNDFFYCLVFNELFLHLVEVLTC
jgi:hypothetical protein